MDITIKFNLENENDKKEYMAWMKIKELTLNLNKLGQMLFEIDECQTNQIIIEQVESIHKYYNEMIWKKLI